MPLRQTSRVASNPKIDIIAVPAIGASPDLTWRFSSQDGPDAGSTIFDEIGHADVYFYEFQRSRLLSASPKTYIDTLAQDFLSSLKKLGIGKRPIHFTAHSTGGAVVKRALVNAARSTKDVSLKKISQLCFSVAFFGVPHFGSQYLSDKTFKLSIKELLSLSEAMDEPLRGLFDPDKNKDHEVWHQQFAFLGTNFKRIWTFAEGRPSLLDRRVHTGSGDNFFKTERLIVEPYSAGLSTAHTRLGSELFIQLNSSTHSSLTRFGDDPEAKEYFDYVRDMSMLIEELELRSNEDLDEVDRETLGYVHLFYQAKQVVPDTDDILWTDVMVLSTPRSIEQLCQAGPDTSMKDEFIQAGTEWKEQTTSTIEEIKVHIKLTMPTPPTSRRNSIVSINLTDPGDNTVDSIDQDGDMKLHRTPMPFIEITTPTPSIEISPVLELVDGNEIESDMKSKSASPAVFDAQRTRSDGGSSRSSSVSAYDNFKAPKRLEVRERPRTMEETFRQQYKAILSHELLNLRFRWIHLPANNMSWIPRIFRSIEEERGAAFLAKDLLHTQVWDSKQHKALHRRSHGTFMLPSCEPLFSQENDYAEKMFEDSQHLQILRSPTRYPQLVVYIPYLHWDTYGSLVARNIVIKRRYKSFGGHTDGQVNINALSPEHKLIWKYIKNSANLPLHQRRSFDQYGYPTLANTESRDSDQVVYKEWLRTHMKKDATQDVIVKPGWLERMRSELARPANPGTAAVKSRKSITGWQEEDAKVLMVDQLWCWILDHETMITCFPPKEADGRGQADPSDLHKGIIEKVQGDPRFTVQCHTPYELAALAVSHAVTGFLQDPHDNDLEVLRIFEQYISILTDRQTQSFKDFRTQQQQASAQPANLRSAPDNSADLHTLLELRDIEDELKILRKLFADQRTVVRRQIETLDATERMKPTGRMKPTDVPDIDKAAMSGLPDIDKAVMSGLPRARKWLQATLRTLDKFDYQVDGMDASCTTAQSAAKNLLDMKQRQANVDEAVTARKSAQEAARQGRAIMVFTIFTIVFLPLSFFTSLFGMNAQEWSGVETNLNLHTIGVLMGAISASVIIIACLLAFSEPIRVIVLWGTTIGVEKLLRGAGAVLSLGWCCTKRRRRQTTSRDEEEGIEESWWTEKKKGRKDWLGRWKESID